jgi:hypothetical protein
VSTSDRLADGAIFGSDLGREAHRLVCGRHLLVAGAVYAALAETGELGAGPQTIRSLVDLLARPLAPVRLSVAVQQLLEPLRDVHGIRDTKPCVV